MRCPHLLVKDDVQICQRMIEAGVDGRVSDFDVRYYCNGNPVNCYYFRHSETHENKSDFHNSLKKFLRS